MASSPMALAPCPFPLSKSMIAADDKVTLWSVIVSSLSCSAGFQDWNRRLQHMLNVGRVGCGFGCVHHRLHQIHYLEQTLDPTNINRPFAEAKVGMQPLKAFAERLVVRVRRASLPGLYQSSPAQLCRIGQAWELKWGVVGLGVKVIYSICSRTISTLNICSALNYKFL
jgi:hypothetical protein